MQRELIKGRSDIGRLSDRELFLIGIALYWAEGTKPKEHRPSAQVEFANSDGNMISLFLKWLQLTQGVENSEIQPVLHIHKNRISDVQTIKAYWSEVTQLPQSAFNRVVVKQHNPRTRRKNVDENYHGLLALRVRRSTMLNRRIQGLTYAMIEATK
jgi:hypothetical protein